ncbi:MAG: hypothetical protein IJY23_05725 [Clostridia bacterium]|nr:hypothetical protein [Clostridia bacterium]
MKKILKTVILLMLSLSLSSCSSKNSDDTGDKPGSDFKMIARIEAIDEKITVDVIEAEYTSGVHLVIISDVTDFLDENGKKIKKSDLEAGDTVEILYGGQVMMSYPPQIVAASIKKL